MLLQCFFLQDPMYVLRNVWVVQIAFCWINVHKHMYIPMYVIPFDLLNENESIRAGLPDFSWYMIPKPEKMYQMNTKYTEWL
jgi:hypothetical protein